jgi:hypothetical protein
MSTNRGRPNIKPLGELEGCLEERKHHLNQITVISSGGMTENTYDPGSVGGDAFDCDNHVDGDTNGVYTLTERSKLAGIETGADVTDATNVDAAGAVMESDTTTASMSFVIDEDDMASNLDTKVPTQQSVKAYVDANAGGGGTLSEVPAFAILYVPASTGLYYEETNHDVRIRTSKVDDTIDILIPQGFIWQNNALKVFI